MTDYGRHTAGLIRSIELGLGWLRRLIPAQPPAPPAAPGLATAAVGGTIAAGTYTLAVSYVDADGRESFGSATAQIVTAGATSTITVTTPAPSGRAVAYYVYCSQAGGAVLTRQQAVGSPTALGANFVLTAPPTNTGANPSGPSAPFTETVPGGTMRRYVTISATLTTSAVAGNRIPQIRLLDGDGNVLWSAAPAAAVAASTTVTLRAATTLLGPSVDAAGNVIIGLPDLFLSASDRLSLTMTGAQAGDNFAPAMIVSEEYTDGAGGYEQGNINSPQANPVPEPLDFRVS